MRLITTRGATNADMEIATRVFAGKPIASVTREVGSMALIRSLIVIIARSLTIEMIIYHDT
jgi:hypothetical protein